MKKVKLYRANDYFKKDFPFAIRHVINRAEEFNKNMRFRREFWKITYLIDGSGEIIINDQAYPLCSNSIMLVHPNSITTYDMTSDSFDLYNIVFDHSFIREELEKLKDDFQFFSVFSDSFPQEREPSIYIQEGDRRIQRLIREMVDEYDGQPVNYQYFLKLKLLELIILMLRTGENSVRRSGPEKIVEYIDHFLCRNFQNEINLEQLARQTGVTGNYLCFVYKKRTGSSIIARQKKMRLDYAAGLLKNTNSPIIEICYTCGFNDASYFYRSFSEEFGCNPGSFRKEKIGQN